MRVWRVAHSTLTEGGFPSGPYTAAMPADTYERLQPMYDLHCGSRWPPPHRDEELCFIRATERCGFASRADLDSWFAGYLGALHDVGFRVWIYDVPAARVGQHGQTLFLHDAATFVRTEPLVSTPVQMELF